MTHRERNQEEWTIGDVRAAFEAAGNPMDRAGYAMCPVHGGEKPKLQVSVKNGRLMCHCFVCGFSRQEEVFKAVISQILKKDSAIKVLKKTDEHVIEPGAIGKAWEALREVEATYYTAAKGVGAYGLRVSPFGDTCVPMRNAGGFGEVCGIQRVLTKPLYDGRNKLNDKGSKPKGAAHLIGYSGDVASLRGKTLVICEGYATAASVFELAGKEKGEVIGACAFGLGNVRAVAREIEQIVGGLGAKLLLTFDDDTPGREEGERLRAEGYKIAYPAGTGKGTDWNDLALKDFDAASAELLCALAEAKEIVLPVRQQEVGQRSNGVEGEEDGDGEGKEKGKARRKKKEKAGSLEYLDLLRACYGEREPRLDLVSGEIKVFEFGGWRRPCMKVLRAAARLSDGLYDYNAILDHLGVCARGMTPEILLDRDEVWDGEDRIAHFTRVLRAERFSSEELRVLIGHWLVGVLRKANNPVIQNRVLVLQGSSGCGKDVWIRNLLRCFASARDPRARVVEGYVSNLTISGAVQEEDFGRFMCNNLVVNISEIDKIKGDQRAAAIFKSITTAESLGWRRKYEEDVTSVPCRASIVASLNPKEINEDSAGARRYLPIELVGLPFDRAERGKAAIDWGYQERIEAEGETFFRQLRAQVWAEYEAAPGEVRLPWNVADSLQEVQETLTPSDEVMEVLESVWEEIRDGLTAGAILADPVKGKTRIALDGVAWECVAVPNRVMTDVLRSATTGSTWIRRAQMRMSSYKLRWRNSSQRGYWVPITKVD